MVCCVTYRVIERECVQEQVRSGTEGCESQQAYAGYGSSGVEAAQENIDDSREQTGSQDCANDGMSPDPVFDPREQTAKWNVKVWGICTQRYEQCLKTVFSVSQRTGGKITSTTVYGTVHATGFLNAYFINNKLRDMTSIPATSPSRLSCPLP